MASFFSYIKSMFRHHAVFSVIMSALIAALVAIFTTWFSWERQQNIEAQKNEEARILEADKNAYVKETEFFKHDLEQKSRISHKEIEALLGSWKRLIETRNALREMHNKGIADAVNFIKKELFFNSVYGLSEEKCEEFLAGMDGLSEKEIGHVAGQKPENRAVAVIYHRIKYYADKYEERLTEFKDYFSANRVLFSDSFKDKAEEITREACNIEKFIQKQVNLLLEKADKERLETILHAADDGIILLRSHFDETIIEFENATSEILFVKDKERKVEQCKLVHVSDAEGAKGEKQVE